MSTALVYYDQARQALAEARNLDEVRAIRDKAETLRIYLRQQKESRELQNYVAEIKLRAERRAGELLAEMEKNPGGQAEHESYPFHDGRGRPSTLADLGLSFQQSHRWQLEASVPEEDFERYLAQVKSAPDSELTSVGLIQLARRLRVPEKANTPPLPEGRFRCVVLDPPWPMVKIERYERPMQGIALDYPTMTLDAIAALPIRDLADMGGCHLYLWVTHRFLPDGLHLMLCWGFRYQCVMTWVKPTGITPYSWMYNTEHVLFGTTGSLPLQRMGLKLAFEAPTSVHSAKPDIFYERVIEASLGPRLDMFARKNRIGFEVWGNEIGLAI